MADRALKQSNVNLLHMLELKDSLNQKRPVWTIRQAKSVSQELKGLVTHRELQGLFWEMRIKYNRPVSNQFRCNGL